MFKRPIQVSTDVYAAIWSDRQAGEDDEDAILARKFGVARGKPHASKHDLEISFGFHDPRFGVKLKTGFEVFRIFKGKEYKARAIQGFWVLSETGLGYPSLNELSRAIGAGVENAWQAWFYIDEHGKRRRMSALRDPSKIGKRGRETLTLEDLGL